MILSGPHSLIQTVYDDQLLTLEAVAIDEASGKIAICSSEEVHIYKPYGKKEGALKVRSLKRESRPSCKTLTNFEVVIPVIFKSSKPRQRHIDAIMGVGGRAIDRLLFSKALPDWGR